MTKSFLEWPNEEETASSDEDVRMGSNAKTPTHVLRLRARLVQKEIETKRSSIETKEHEIELKRKSIENERCKIKLLENTLADIEQIITPTTFTRFPSMPMELQLLVWKYAARQRVRVVLGALGRFASKRTGMPAVFHACRNARRIAIEECSPRFSQSFLPFHRDSPKLVDSLILAIAAVPVLAELRYIELVGHEFDNGYSHRQTTICKKIPGLEKLTLHGERKGGILEYYNVKGKRHDETLLQFWCRKRGPWDLFTLLQYHDDDSDDDIKYGDDRVFWWQAEEEIKHSRSFLQAVDDGLFCDTAHMPLPFEEEQSRKIRALRIGDTYIWYLPVQLRWFLECDENTDIYIKASGIMFPTNTKGMVWNGFTDWRKNTCLSKSEKASRADEKRQSAIFLMEMHLFGRGMRMVRG